jgi:ribosome-associated heat shock protein Hsp15
VSDKCRLDVWLWRARFFKTRTLSAAHVGAAGIWIKRAGVVRKIDKPGETIGAGDEMTFSAHRQAVSLRVLATGERRGPASEARTLFVLLDGEESPGHVSDA